MKLLPTRNQWLLRRSARIGVAPVWVWIPNGRRQGEINFHRQDRRLFGCFDPAFVIPFRYEGRRWASILQWIQGTTPEVWEHPPHSQEAVSKVMEGLRTQFTQHPGYRMQLISTKYRVLRYDNARDAFWGCGPTGAGENRYGRLLMALRKEFSKEVTS
ncbi:MAG: NADAR family protein [Verrucomicrobia bacterium]|nr:NADAR family protein [Verrucomicrobiota bacterium]MCH8514663.1 NADAR family protein [Kiritimatiellia bacterium]